MKPVSYILLLLATTLPSLPAIAKEPQYSVTHGEELNIRDYNGFPIRSSDMICKDSDCYQITSTLFLPPAIKKHYGLIYVNYKELSLTAETPSNDEQLILPQDLGFELYHAARKDAIRDLLTID